MSKTIHISTYWKGRSIKIKLEKIAHRVLCLFKSRKLLESTELIGTTFVVLTRRRGWRTRTGSSSIFFFHIGHGDGSTAPREVTAEAGCPPRIWRLCTLVNVSPVSGGSIISHTCIAGHLICFISKYKRSTSFLLQSISMEIKSGNYYICILGTQQCSGRSRVIERKNWVIWLWACRCLSWVDQHILLKFIFFFP